MMELLLLNYSLYWHHGESDSLATIVPNRHQLGWIYCGSVYCQLIRHANTVKHLEWAQAHIDDFDNVIWSDETTVQLENHRHFCYRKEGEKPRPKPHPKHPIKVHVWGGISKKGATAVCNYGGSSSELQDP